MNYLQSRHTTKDGSTMLVSQMETSHLLNTVRYFLRQVVEIVPTVEPVNDNKVKNALYGKNNFDAKASAEAIDRSIFELSPYIVEMFFRTEEINSNPGFAKTRGEIIEQLKIVLMRDGKLEGFPVRTSNLLPGRNIGDIIENEYVRRAMDDLDFPPGDD